MSDDQEAPEEARELLPIREAILAVADDVGQRIREFGSRDSLPQDAPEKMETMVRHRDRLVALAGESEADVLAMIAALPSAPTDLTTAVRQLAHHVQETHEQPDQG